MIDYHRLSNALSYYTALGYTYVEVPWIVPRSVSRITVPAHCKPTATEWDGDLIGSGEQGFLDLMNRGELLPGRYVCLTPCFRDEPEENALTRPYFMKVELIDTLDPDPAAVKRMVDQAFGLFSTEIGCCIESYRDSSCVDRNGYDIVTEEPDYIELGSYGLRAHGSLKWAFGTGLAEPRFSVALGIQKAKR